MRESTMPLDLPDGSERLLTPCLLLYPERVLHNLKQSIVIAGDASRLRPHVKTHKCPNIVQMALELGIRRHKCATLREAAMLAECGVEDALIAYPMVGTNTARLAELVAAFPETRFAALVEDPAVAERLNRTFAKCGLQLDVLVDIDTGMHRTGIAPDRRAVELYRQVNSLPALRPRGLHVYDGQNHMPSPQERSRAVEQICQTIQQLLAAIRGAGFDVQELVCGGTPTFPMFADVSIEGYAGALECSPGTCVLSDANYAQAFPDLGDFQFAALLLTRVISKQHAGQVTLDLGNKAVAADPPLDRRVFLPRLPDARILGHNEEHMIVQSAAADNLDLGDTLIAIPGHVCPTVALHECFQLVEGGRITDQWPITARRRDYRLAGNVEASC